MWSYPALTVYTEELHVLTYTTSNIERKSYQELCSDHAVSYKKKKNKMQVQICTDRGSAVSSLNNDREYIYQSIWWRMLNTVDIPTAGMKIPLQMGGSFSCNRIP